MRSELYFRALRQTRSPDNDDKARRFSILEQLARFRSGRFAEVGCWLGHSTWILAEIGFSVDVWDTFTGTPKNDEPHWPAGEFPSDYQMFLRRFARFPHVEVHRGDVKDASPSGPYDLVHLDVDIAASYRAAINLFWPELRPGGVMVFDDYGYERTVPATSVIDALVPPLSDLFVSIPGGGAFAIK